MMNTKDLSNMNTSEKAAYSEKAADLLDFAQLLTAEKTEGLSQVLACLRIQAMANAVI